jgi:hypothetical protein
MGKKAKEHRKKVAKRNRIIAQERQRYEKLTNQIIQEMQSATNESDNLYNSGLNLPLLSGPLSLPNFTEDINTTIQSGPQV